MADFHYCNISRRGSDMCESKGHNNQASSDINSVGEHQNVGTDNIHTTQQRDISQAKLFTGLPSD